MMMKMILLSLAGNKFSSSVEQIKHILAGPDVFPLVCLRRGISGVFLYEGEPIPVLDPKELPELDVQNNEIGEGYLIVFQSEYGNVGLPVDAAVSIVDAEDGIFENVAPVDEKPTGGQMFCYQDTSYPLLDMDEILAHLTG
jgi:chemotaxis signal transduction protein